MLQKTFHVWLFKFFYSSSDNATFITWKCQKYLAGLIFLSCK